VRCSRVESPRYFMFAGRRWRSLAVDVFGTLRYVRRPRFRWGGPSNVPCLFSSTVLKDAMMTRRPSPLLTSKQTALTNHTLDQALPELVWDVFLPARRF